MPAISTMQMFIIMGLIVLSFSIYQAMGLQNKISCTFIRKDRTEIHKFAKVTQGRVDFDNAYYNIVPDRVTLKRVWCGIIPTYVKCAKWKWDSNMPIDPATWNNDYDNPADRKALDKTEDLRALLETQKSALAGKSGGKKSLLESLTPILMIGGLIIIGYLVYRQQSLIDRVGYGQNAIQEMLMKIQQNLPK